MSKTWGFLFAIVGLVGAITMPVLASEAYGDPFTGEGFVKDDWQLVCDNTLTCRAAGYSEEGAVPASMLLVVEPNKASVTAYVDFINLEGEFSQSAVGKIGEPTLWLNNQNYGPIKYEQSDGRLRLNATQTKQVIGHARINSKIEIKAAQKVWQISDKGLTAILLKLDEVQGRVGTPLALVSKNTTSSLRPKSPKPLPKIYAAKAYPYSLFEDQKAAANIEHRYESWQGAMTDWIKPTLNQDEAFCDALAPERYPFNEKTNWQFTPIDAHHTLASRSCWLGAYNVGVGFWVIDHDNPSKPKLVTTSGSDYDAGEIIAAHKGRGLGDCWSRQTWVWNGRNFVLAEESTSGMCRGFAGGAWDLPTYVSEVIKPKLSINLTSH